MLVLRRVVLAPIQQAVAAANALADGDLTVRVHAERDDEIGRLLAAMRAYGRAAGRHHRPGARRSGQSVVGVGEVSATAQSPVAGRQPAGLVGGRNLQHALEQASASVSNKRKTPRHPKPWRWMPPREAEAGGGRSAAMCAPCSRLPAKVGIIDDIAYQTNLLALNAAIEAARRRAWQRLCRGGGGGAQTGRAQPGGGRRNRRSGRRHCLRQAERAGELLHRIVPAIGRTADLVREIAAASDEQSAGVARSIRRWGS